VRLLYKEVISVLLSKVIQSEADNHFE